MEYLAKSQWIDLAAAHQERAEKFTRDHLVRRRRQESHPVWDFLFDYYPIRPAQLQRWHPGIGRRLLGDPPHESWRDYARFPDGVGVATHSYCTRRAGSLRYIAQLLERTNDNPIHFDCFGLHEWAMVFETTPRHGLPLRLGPAETNEVVRSHSLRCTHFDAYRFFSSSARPLNLRVLSREEQSNTDQAGCLHATMDLYKWAHKLGPLVPGELWLDTFALAAEARVLDMEASPYDVTGLGFGVVAIETPEGKAEYVARQRRLAQRGSALRRQLVAVLATAKADMMPLDSSEEGSQ